jgi:hypothetical protein
MRGYTIVAYRMHTGKIKLYVLFALLALVVSVDAQAQTTTASTTVTELQATTTASSSLPVAPQANAPVIPKSPKPLPLEIQNRVINLAANMSNRADALVIRFDLIIVRIESRLKKMEMQGYDTSDARFYVNEAKLSLELARTSISGIDAKIRAFTTAENYWTGWFEVRDTFTEVRTQLQKTKQLLTEATTDMQLTMKDNIKVDTQATSTASSTAATQN